MANAHDKPLTQLVYAFKNALHRAVQHDCDGTISAHRCGEAWEEADSKEKELLEAIEHLRPASAGRDTDRELLLEIANSGVASESKHYVEVQIDWPTWDALQDIKNAAPQVRASEAPKEPSGPAVAAPTPASSEPRSRPRPGEGTECQKGVHHCTFPECACPAPSVPDIQKVQHHIEQIRLALADVCDGLEPHPGSTLEANIYHMDQAIQAAMVEVGSKLSSPSATGGSQPTLGACKAPVATMRISSSGKWRCSECSATDERPECRYA